MRKPDNKKPGFKGAKPSYTTKKGDAPPKRKPFGKPGTAASANPGTGQPKYSKPRSAPSDTPKPRIDSAPKPEKPKSFDEVISEQTGPRPVYAEKPAPRRESKRTPRAEGEAPKSPKLKKKGADAPVPEPKPYVAPEPVLFATLGLSEQIERAISEMGFENATPIQARAIPVLLSGRDLIGQAQTGTGKTAAFALPLIQKIFVDVMETQALVLAPTRELAIQVAAGIYEFAKHTGVRVVPVYGGQPIDRQFRALRQGAQIVVGTPGRVLDHLRRGSLSLANVATAVLDEADEMLALGFAEDLEAILAELPEDRQLAFFSATMPPRIMDLTRKFLRDPVHVTIEAGRRTVETTNQTYYEVPPGKKLEALARVLDMESPGSTIVFCRTRQETNDLCEALRIRGYSAEALHGDMGQAERDRVMRRFRDGSADLLIATDVAARGLDVDSVTHVINYDIPWDVEQYIHRIGRTGRAGRSGDAITLVEGRERRQLQALERMIGSKIKPARVPTAADIAARRRDMFADRLREALDGGQFESQIELVESLSEIFDPAEVAAAAIQLLWESQHSNSEQNGEALAVDFEQPEMGMVRIFLGMGRQDGLRPADIVGAIANEAGIPAKAVGVIDILDGTSFVEVPANEGQKVLDALRNTKLRNKRIKVEFARPGDVPRDGGADGNNRRGPRFGRG